MDDFAKLLRKLRTEAGLSQNALARRAGVDPSYINRIEKSERQPPSAGVIHEISKALELDESDIDQLLLSAGYAPARISANPRPVSHRGLRLVSDFLSDESVLPEDKDLIERELDLLEQHIRLIRRPRPSRVDENPESN